MIEERKYFNLDVEEINDFNGCKLVLESHYGVNFHSADGKEIKMLIEYSDDYRHCLNTGSLQCKLHPFHYYSRSR